MRVVVSVPVQAAVFVTREIGTSMMTLITGLDPEVAVVVRVVVSVSVQGRVVVTRRIGVSTTTLITGLVPELTVVVKVWLSVPVQGRVMVRRLTGVSMTTDTTSLLEIVNTEMEVPVQLLVSVTVGTAGKVDDVIGLGDGETEELGLIEDVALAVELDTPAALEEVTDEAAAVELDDDEGGFDRKLVRIVGLESADEPSELGGELEIRMELITRVDDACDVGFDEDEPAAGLDIELGTDAELTTTLEDAGNVELVEGGDEDGSGILVSVL